MDITLPSGRKIGSGHAPFIIAEVGSNWRDLSDCLHSVSMAKAAGADAVKFQLFDPKALYGRWPDGDGPGIGCCPYLDPKWLPELKAKADREGIEFMCTAFSPELYEVVDPFVNIHKVASAEMTHVQILEEVRSFGKPVILSTGAHTRSDIVGALNMLQFELLSDRTYNGAKLYDPSNLPVALMYCVAAYPARDIDFRIMQELQKYKLPVGYSDHSIDYAVIPKAAVDAGASIIEKHFTDIPEVDTPDRGHSLTVDEFKVMVQTIRGTRPFQWGSGEEREMLTRHHRRLIATRDIPAGGRLHEGENYGAYRSLKDDTRGLSPFATGQVHNRVATKAIMAGDAIGPGDFT